MLPPKNPLHQSKQSTSGQLYTNGIVSNNSNSSQQFSPPKLTSGQYRFQDYQGKITQADNVKQAFSFLPENQPQPSRGSQNYFTNKLSSSGSSFSLPEVPKQTFEYKQSSTPSYSGGSNLSTTMENSVMSKVRNFNSSQSNSRSQLQNTGNLMMQEIPGMGMVKIQHQTPLSKNSSPMSKKTSQLFIQTPSMDYMKPAQIMNPPPANHYKSVLTDKIRLEIYQTQLHHKSSHSIAEQDESKKITTFDDVRERFIYNKPSDAVTDENTGKDFSFKPTYSFQKMHPTYVQKLKYSLNYEQQEQHRKEKEIKDKKDAEDKLKQKLEKEKLQKNLANYLVMDIKDQVLSRQQYKKQLEEDKVMAKDIIAFIKRRFVRKALAVYNVLKWKRTISKFLFKYCMTFYKEHQRRQEAKLVFDEIDSGTPSPMKKKKTEGIFHKKEEKKSMPTTPMTNVLSKVMLWTQTEVQDRIEEQQKKKRLAEVLKKHFMNRIKAKQQEIEDEHDDQENDDYNLLIMEEQRYQELQDAEEDYKQIKDHQSSNNVLSYNQKKKDKIRFIKKKKI